MLRASAPPPLGAWMKGGPQLGAPLPGRVSRRDQQWVPGGHDLSHCHRFSKGDMVE